MFTAASRWLEDRSERQRWGLAGAVLLLIVLLSLQGPLDRIDEQRDGYAELEPLDARPAMQDRLESMEAGSTAGQWLLWIVDLVPLFAVSVGLIAWRASGRRALDQPVLWGLGGWLVGAALLNLVYAPRQVLLGIQYVTWSDDVANPSGPLNTWPSLADVTDAASTGEGGHVTNLALLAALLAVLTWRLLWPRRPAAAQRAPWWPPTAWRAERRVWFGAAAGIWLVSVATWGWWGADNAFTLSDATGWNLLMRLSGWLGLALLLGLTAEVLAQWQPLERVRQERKPSRVLATSLLLGLVIMWLGAGVSTVTESAEAPLLDAYLDTQDRRFWEGPEADAVSPTFGAAFDGLVDSFERQEVVLMGAPAGGGWLVQHLAGLAILTLSGAAVLVIGIGGLRVVGRSPAAASAVDDEAE